MLTFQDFLKVPQNDQDRAKFVKELIAQHKNSELYKTAVIAQDYDNCRNTTTMQYQKTITDVNGRVSVDKYATVHRSTSNFFDIIVTQFNQYLLGNGVVWKNKTNIGNRFDHDLQSLGKQALISGVAYGFWDLDRLRVFSVLEFAPLEDEENGALMAGVRFWQLDKDKPLRATLYELDGFTDYMFTDKDRPQDKWIAIDRDIYMMPKRAYKLLTRESVIDGVEIYAGENYAGFPIIPLWANPRKKSELVGLREKIDAYDFILNGWEDDLDSAQLYWIIKGAGGMDDPDLMRFLDRLRNVKAAAPEDGQDVEPVTVDIPVEARETLLSRLEKQIYRDAMVMNPEDLASSAATATQIRAAYERQNVKADQYEYCIIDFLFALGEIAGFDDEPTFTRSTVVNVQEEVQTVVTAAAYLSSDYVTTKILNLLGDGDRAEEMLKQMDADAADRLGKIDENPDEGVNNDE